MFDTSKNRTTIMTVIPLLGLLLFAWGCQPVTPLPQPRYAPDPGSTAGGLRTLRWDVAAIGYHYTGEGINYEAAGLYPVFLIFKNKSQQAPVVLLGDVRGRGYRGEYMVYHTDEAARLVMASEEARNTAANMMRSGAAGAAAGAGLGALIGLLTGGNDRIWQGALIGGAIGGTAGAASSIGDSRMQLHDAVIRELHHYKWQEAPILPMSTSSGYLYLPGGLGINQVTIVVRTDTDVNTLTLPVQPPTNWNY